MAKRRERERVSARRRAETHNSGFTKTTLKVGPDVGFFEIKEAKVRRVDILPYRVGKGNPWADEGTLHFERTYWAHRGIGANSETYVCPAKTAKKRCPICEARTKLMKDPDGEEQLIKDLAPKERQLFNVIDLEDRDKGVQIFDLSFHLFGKQLEKEVKDSDDEDGYEYFSDLQEGSSLRLGVEEKSFSGTKFYEVATVGFKPRKTPYDDDILEQVHNLDDALAILPYEELKAIFLQTDDDDVDMGSNASDKPKKKPAAEEDDWEDEPRPKKRPTPPAEEDEGEPEPKPKKRPKPPVDEDEFEDEEPAEKPKKKPKPAADDDEWEDEEPAKHPSDNYKVGDKVGFMFKEKKVSGLITKINKESGTCLVQSDAREKPFPVPLVECKLLALGAAPKKPAKPPVEEDEWEDEEPEEKPKPKPKKPSKPAAEEEDWEDEEPAPKPKPKKPKPAADDEWEDD